jgi:hypothetical protein
MPEIVLIPLINWKLSAVKLVPVAKHLKTETTYPSRSCICLCGMIVLPFIVNACNKKTKTRDPFNLRLEFESWEKLKKLSLYV